MDIKTTWFTLKEVFDLIYHQLFVTANSLGQQLTTSQLFQPLIQLTLALVATVMH
jgi:hypothetical protein